MPKPKDRPTVSIPIPIEILKERISVEDAQKQFTKFVDDYLDEWARDFEINLAEAVRRGRGASRGGFYED